MSDPIKPKIPYLLGKEMVSDGIISETTLEQMIRDDKVAGPREKESYRLKGLSGDIPITASFPSPSVTLPAGVKLSDLGEHDRKVVEDYKASLGRILRPEYEKHREKYTDKVLVPNP